jgi:2-oxoglutarate/2-oxoacid ferredoxin oxidoreductase subunit beta
MKKDNKNLGTEVIPTWCPGCFNFQILGGFKNFLEREIKSGKKKKDFAIVSGIGCSGKIFDYVDLNGLNTLHGREIPSALGIKVGNPNLDIYSFLGDGGTYGEGLAHLISAARENYDMTCIVHNNQVFALTVGQPTPVTEQKYSDKTTPFGVKDIPLNPIKLLLASNASFVARVFADVKQIEWILEKAKKHQGFKFIEVIQPCLIFHPDKNYKERGYFLHEKGHNTMDLQAAMKKADEWDYNGLGKSDKIPLGIFYKQPRTTFIEKHSALKKLQNSKRSWKDIKR